MGIELPPLEWEDLPPMMSVEECRRFLQVSDHSCRKFAREHGIYIKVGGSARIPRKGLEKVLLGDVDPPTKDPAGTEVLEFPRDETDESDVSHR